MTTRVDITSINTASPHDIALRLETEQGEFDIIQDLYKPLYAVYFYNDNTMDWDHIVDTVTLSEAVIAVEHFEYVEDDEDYTCDTDEPFRVRDYVEEQYFGDEYR